MEIKLDKEAILRQLDEAVYGADNAEDSEFKDLYYENGVANALDWILGHTEILPMSDDD